MAEEIEVFQDMALRGPLAKRPELRAALIAAADGTWQADLDRSSEIARNAATTEDVVLFRRAADKGHPAAELALWGTNDGYRVSNIVPRQVGRLSFSQYNAILADFVARVAEPVSGKYGFVIDTTEPCQTLDDWLSPDAAAKLRLFSHAANKSTDATHPLDQRRWFDFVVAVHRAGDRLDADKLARWLHEAENWDEESAHELAGDFEKSLALLEYEHEN